MGLNLACGGLNGLFEQIINNSGSLAFYGNAGFKSLVTAVFTPGLSDHFKFNVGQVTLLRQTVSTDGLHFGEIQGGAALV